MNSCILQISATILTVFERFIKENAHRLEDLFLQMDKDKSGDITLEEFKFGLKDFGIRLTSVSVLCGCITRTQVSLFLI